MSELQLTANCRLCGEQLPPDDIRLQWDPGFTDLKAFHGRCLEEYNATNHRGPSGTDPIDVADSGGSVGQGDDLPRYQLW